MTSVLLFTFKAAPAALGNPDTVLSYERFIRTVKQHHPVSVQARLWEDAARAKELQARGNFDPVAFTEVDRKAFEERTYYELIDGGIKLPTWFGAELKGGYERGTGPYRNPQERTPSNGLYYAQLSLPLGQGLFIDERRTELRKAKLFMQRSEQEKRKMLNELTMEASRAYWKWYSAYHRYQVRQRAFRLAKERYRNVRQSIHLGSRPAIDSAEARVLVENRRRKLQEGHVARKNAKQELATFLWKEGSVPLKPDSGIRPQPFTLKPEGKDTISRERIRDSVNAHPVLEKAGIRVEQNELERRWARERLKPELNVHYNFLSEPLGPATRIEPDPRDRKIGLSFRLPIFLRSERGILKRSKVELKRSRVRKQAIRRELMAKAYQAHNRVTTLHDQLASYRRSLDQLQHLVEGERLSYQRGGSSLFMVNQREVRYIKARIRSIQLRSELGIAKTRLRYRLGIY